MPRPQLKSARSLMAESPSSTDLADKVNQDHHRGWKYHSRGIDKKATKATALRREKRQLPDVSAALDTVPLVGGSLSGVSEVLIDNIAGLINPFRFVGSPVQ